MSTIKHHVSGVEYWRSLEQLADTPEMREMVSKEFPGYDANTIATSSRRNFLKFMGASLALAGLSSTGCRRMPEQKVAPYSANPRERIPGIPEQYATSYELGGVATGLLVTSYDGRPIKVEGNPSHPFSMIVKGWRGAADGFAQASLLDLYDPHRSRVVIDRTGGAGAEGKPASWDAFMTAANKTLAGLKGTGDGFAVLCEPMSGPSAQEMKKRFMSAFPKAAWYEYEPLTRDAELEGARMAFGQPVRTRLHLDKAQVVVCLDADPLGMHPAHLRYAADWSDRRRSADKGEMNRVYVAESAFTTTGSIADVRVAVDPGRLYPITRAIAAKLGVPGISGKDELANGEPAFVEKAAADLKQAGAKGILTVGPSAPALVHALGHAINQQLKSIGEAITLYPDPAGDRPTHMQAIASLVADMTGGKVNTLLILGGNPVYDAPADLSFGQALAKVPVSIRFGHYDDETSSLSKWHVPRAHYLESWGDARAWDGTASIVQPLIEPLYAGKSTIELLAILSGDSVTAGDQIVRRTWKDLIKGDDFEKGWRKALEAGVLEDSGFAEARPELKEIPFPASQPPAPYGGPQRSGLYLRFEADNRVYDGRFANNGWLQETPDPMSKLMWDNALLMSKRDADELGMETNDVVKLSANGATTEAAVYVLPGQPIGVASLSLGYGRTAAGPIGNQLGCDAYRLRSTKTPYGVANVSLEKSSATFELAMSINHHLIDDLGATERARRIGKKQESGPLIRETTFENYKSHPRFAQEFGEEEGEEGQAGEGTGRKVPLQLFDPPNPLDTPHKWGMAVDLNTCIGCNACALACQAENNIPVVGKHQTLNHREMNWIRIDRYFKGNPDNSDDIEVVFQPVMCQHCENAPCEQVCPVAATVHDAEGLNTMVYNRCIGTRYCANNCPYKVRRFNYFDFHSQNPRNNWGQPWPNMPDQEQVENIDPIKKMVYNPEVTVRMRGVMEKCSYCVQRIHNTVINRRIQDNGKNADVSDGEIMTACEQACPTQAITFGNLNESGWRVSKLHEHKRAYAMLEDLNTRPRTMYLAKLRNPSGPLSGGMEHQPAARTENAGAEVNS